MYIGDIHEEYQSCLIGNNTNQFRDIMHNTLYTVYFFGYFISYRIAVSCIVLPPEHSLVCATQLIHVVGARRVRRLYPHAKFDFKYATTIYNSVIIFIL